MKSTLWMVATMFANIIIIGIIISLLTMVFSAAFPLYFKAFFSTPAGGIFSFILNWAATLYAIKLGIHTVLKHSAITSQRVLLVSIWMGIVPMIFQVLTIYFLFLKNSTQAISYQGILDFFLTDVAYAVFTYFLFKQALKKTTPPHTS